MMLTIVVAMATNRAIGKDNKLLWHLPADLKHFKSLTSGHTVIMGRKTYDSIGKPLPNRRNIVISRQQDLEIPGIEVVSCLEDATALCNSEEEVFIIGGAQIYTAALAVTGKLEITIVEGDFEADTFFPETDPAQWKEVSRTAFPADEKNQLNYTFLTLIRR
ncbi:dihydrofolate reductase [Pedobacter antarcticus]|uniref:Dihydrofolate reductase n=2 Tax=Pedobacter antarcticus TaxID=34086 RepID=A0A081PDT8_9SPHI|nr:dihydrofolate reductase [Pedobacter antarcticus]KEQ28861.1 dihydrofolate reductase [Pedobacter antarcticus 4BY]SDL66753.1 dihydrofolate reductase [Pedobacter antarcticus]SFE91124.1 dihydrofolate reductase [Pedobacter antarcticus]